LFWLALTHGFKWNTIKKVAVPTKKTANWADFDASTAHIPHLFLTVFGGSALT